MFELKEKKALITGATGGLGAEIARALHQQGAHIVISGTKREKLEELAQELKDRVSIIPCDLGDAESTQRLIPETESVLGGLDILVNNAGLTQDGLVLRMNDEQWARTLEVNLTSVFRLSREAIKGMMKQRTGRIINITSIVGITGNAGQANYAASKAGLIGFSKSLAAELATRGITVNCIAPGFIESPMTAALNDKQREKILSSIPQGNIGSPKDIAAGVVFLASEEARYVTGQTLHINGGMTMI